MNALAGSSIDERVVNRIFEGFNVQVDIQVGPMDSVPVRDQPIMVPLAHRGVLETRIPIERNRDSSPVHKIDVETLRGRAHTTRQRLIPRSTLS
jgi:hypothetical protein